MVDLSTEELAKLKGQGFLLMKDKEQFVCRVVYPAGMATSQMLKDTAYLAEKYAKGSISVTVRLNMEITGIPYENIAPMQKEMDEKGLIYGGTGPKVRPLVCCKGTVCKFGMIDTQALCKELHDKFYGMQLPHKFKINITGCPNNCAKAQLNDLAFMGAPKGNIRLFIGGKFGRQSLMGQEICKIPVDKASDAATVCTDFFKEYGKPKQRFGDLLEDMKDTPQYAKLIEDIKVFAVV